MASKYRVAVVGAGIMGSSTAKVLSKRGHEVSLFEQFAIGHDRGSSHGASRIVRKAYPDSFYTGIMAEGHSLWAELQEESNIHLLHEVGLVYFGQRSSESLSGVVQGLDQLRVPYSLVDRIGQIQLRSNEMGILTPEAGWVNADLAVQASIQIAKAHGTQIRCERVGDLDWLLRDFDQVVLAAGPWIRDFVNVPVRVTAQTFAYLDGLIHEGPVWIEDGPKNLYGFPTEPNASGVKMALHFPAVEASPNQGIREPIVPSELAEFARTRMNVANPEFGRAKTCLYTSTLNEDFLWGQLGERVHWVSACSGHGFKFGPWIGRQMADFVEGTARPEATSRFYWPAN